MESGDYVMGRVHEGKQRVNDGYNSSNEMLTAKR